MRIFPVIKKVIVQGGDIPAGAAVMSDTVDLFAAVTLPDTADALTDEILTAIDSTYTDSIASLSEAITAGMMLDADTIAEMTETAMTGLVAAEPIDAQTETACIALDGFAESIATPDEALTAGVSGYAESTDPQSETLAATTHTWATSNTTSGTAPTNPTNAHGSNNGTLANVKAGGIANGTSTLTLTIPRASIPNAGTYTFVAYYRTNAGVSDTFTLTYTDTGGNPVTIDLPDGDFLTTPHSTAITSLHATNNITVEFTHSVAVIATGGSIDVDAVGIRCVGAF